MSSKSYVEADKFYMVTGERDTPKVRQSTKGKAESEADRLAQENPGKLFYVLEAVACYRVATTVRTAL